MTAATEYLLFRRRDRAFLAFVVVAEVLCLTFVVLLIAAMPDVFPPQVTVPIVLNVVLPLGLIVVIKRRRVAPAERVARSLGNAFVVSPTPGLSDLLARFSPTGAPPQRHFPIETDDAGLHFLPERGGAAFATIPWESVERVDGGDQLRIVLDEDTNVMLQPMGRVFPLGAAGCARSPSGCEHSPFEPVDGRFDRLSEITSRAAPSSARRTAPGRPRARP